MFFFDIAMDRNNQNPVGRFAIREQTDAYIFELHQMNYSMDLNLAFREGMNNLRHILIHDFDSTRVYYLTEYPNKAFTLNIIDSVVIHDLYLYQIQL